MDYSNGDCIGYEPSFLEALEPALEDIAKKGLKLACNAGCVATKDLYEEVVKMVEEKDQAVFTQIGENRVRLSGMVGRPPPSTTKCGLTAFGGYQAEVHWPMVGLDIGEKVRLLEAQLRHGFGKERLDRLDYWNVTVYGSAPENPRSQNVCTVDFTEYFPTLIPQPTQTIRLSQGYLQPITIEPPTETISHPAPQPTYAPTDPVQLSSFGPTTKSPLGRVVYSTTGDKGSDFNVGFFAQDESESPWLRSLLSSAKLVELMGVDYHGQKIDRMEFPRLWAVHCLLHNHLDRGVTTNTTHDVVGKFIAEYLKAKYIDVSNFFLAKGTL
ncbi:DUF1446-domain-containing protein [Venturia nashicola]|uniref:DUF1446-domain-containing protein n=1 Tax=Venturia nashicola TaxID=86259 RepID=A0A4Z1NWM0_9PEZI|nr:DUF1446-domain-containing protein [Venturia nashicola]